MKHIVYLIKVHREELPNRYIGSKSNCIVENGKILTNRKKEYVGSAMDATYKEIVSTFGYTLQVLGEFQTYYDALEAERDLHIKHDVVASCEYFNKSVATISNYADPDYATYKHVGTGKIARLKRNHPLVLSGDWVGVTKGITLSEEDRKKRGRSGNENGFYGRKHTDETKQISGKKIGDAHRGKPKTAEQRAKMAETRRMWWANRKAGDSGGKEEGV